jgi:hypothetical protein
MIKFLYLLLTIRSKTRIYNHIKRYSLHLLESKQQMSYFVSIVNVAIIYCMKKMSHMKGDKYLFFPEITPKSSNAYHIIILYIIFVISLVRWHHSLPSAHEYIHLCDWFIPRSGLFSISYQIPFSK